MYRTSKIYGNIANGAGSGGSGSTFTSSNLVVVTGTITLPSYSFVVGLFYLGQRLEEGVGYTKLGNTVTLTGVPAISNGETIVAITQN